MGPDVWPEYGMFVWLAMVVCVDYFVGISYTTNSLENQVVFACFLFIYLVIVIY